jgi:hypothetical protein
MVGVVQQHPSEEVGDGLEWSCSDAASEGRFEMHLFKQMLKKVGTAIASVLFFKQTCFQTTYYFQTTETRARLRHMRA